MRAFSLHELAAEKLRALPKQPGRNRCRRKDVYDIAALVEHRPMTDQDLVVIHRTLVEKCATRASPRRPSRWRTLRCAGEPRRTWESLELELSVALIAT